jgi:hypothetical protein
MTKIEVLGPGCANCKRLEQVAREAVVMASEAEIVKVTDYRRCVAYGVAEHARPRHRRQGRRTGRIPSAGDIAVWLYQS